MNPNTPQWESQFGAAYAVPDEIAKAPILTDESWHNDVSPKFSTQARPVKGALTRLCLWVDHIDANERETGPETPRFRVCSEVYDAGTWQDDQPAPMLSTEDAAEALRKAEKFLADNPAPPMPEAEPLARDFAAVLKEWLTPEEMAETIKRNDAETDDMVCHSHDFCDANMAMDAAFAKAGIEVDCQNQEQADRWSEAWDIAKAAKFWAA